MATKDISQCIICVKCNQPKTVYHWCPNSKEKKSLETKVISLDPNWTSGNKNVDAFIKEIQSNAQNQYESLKWIPYDHLSQIEYLAKGGFGTIHKAVWNHEFGTTDVAIKRIYNSQDISSEFLNELKRYLQCTSIASARQYVIKAYGISRDPETGEFLMITQYAEMGDLRDFSNNHFDDSIWWNKTIIDLIFGIAKGLIIIHSTRLVHRDLHSGNVLIKRQQFSSTKYSSIGDLGLCQPADQILFSNPTEGIHGVIPYIAPEILLGQTYSPAADIYSFGIIMWELSMKNKPFCDRPHDEKLVYDILKGVRPKIPAHMPESYVNLMKKCWDKNPRNRPTSFEIGETIEFWKKWCLNTTLKVNTELLERFKKEKKQKTHPNAIYTSRYLRYKTIGQNQKYIDEKRLYTNFPPKRWDDPRGFSQIFIALPENTENSENNIKS
ncbi:hypothetical protein Glove_22g157 [Diversispora epigaea]|uniref:Protein kinase domain-containing protein n=1 Tax=Diversispora epigaea TaxID=1348612 RepID=A0A397JTB5_9GLOM|nr:hypothetical protein Glove_22g157 [Diversispora epigaea]